MKNILNNIDMGWNFDNSYLSLPDKLFTKINPTPVSNPSIVLLNFNLAKKLGLKINDLDLFALVASGNLVPTDSSPIAQAYAGHQFGNFTILGDGRAILLGEHIDPSSERWDIQLKGSGRTPYSRGGDGRAALGPMLREYIISEGMNGLNIPTTRSLSVALTGDSVKREKSLSGSILLRVASSHIRVGTFEYASLKLSNHEKKALLDYTIDRHFPECWEDKNPYISFLDKVILRQAKLIAMWQSVGFIHGVMNTDNMSINGETIDYGPCAFMDEYNNKTVFSSIDLYGRYAYGNQPYIAAWNLARFAETIIEFLDNKKETAIEIAQARVSRFSELYSSYYLEIMGRKIGIDKVKPSDEVLIKDILKIMEETKSDFTNTFLDLTFERHSESKIYTHPDFNTWNLRWLDRLKEENSSKKDTISLMKKSNPAVIPRNYFVEEAIKDATENQNYSKIYKLINAISDPYSHDDYKKEFASPPFGKNYKTYCGT